MLRLHGVEHRPALAKVHTLQLLTLDNTKSVTKQTSVYENQPATELVKEKLMIRTDRAFAARTSEAPAELMQLLFLYE